MINLPNETLQRTAAWLGSRTVQEKSLATLVADRAFPAAVAELVVRPLHTPCIVL